MDNTLREFIRAVRYFDTEKFARKVTRNEADYIVAPRSCVRTMQEEP